MLNAERKLRLSNAAGISPVRGCPWVEVEEDGSSSMSPLSRSKLTSRTMMLLDDSSSSGRPPERKL
ncbi:hypothetical protein U9M48_025663 [Paspalum notatum var. saurae]|uniref:Uncharacterized protein n=1 Tax=Paspalum notatum var. saurae TaxID=547442 RepID=A0AAQ3TQK5_PASNO